MAKEYKRVAMSDKDALKLLMDPVWRLTHLYQIRTKVRGYEGQSVTFYPNRVQRQIYRKIAEGKKRIIILKPRKLGVTTAICLYLLDKAMYSPNQMCRTIAHRKQTVGELFNDIVYFAFNRIADGIRPNTRHMTRNELSFDEFGSKYSIDVEARGLTPTFLHFSEIAYVDDEPKLQDTLESLPPTAVGIAESTANGRGNWFERTFMSNWQLLQNGEEPEWYPLFFPWWDDPENQTAYVPGTRFYYEHDVRKMRAKYPHLTDSQLLWWDRKKFQLGERLPELYPSEPDEAFIFSTGKVYGEFTQSMHVLPHMEFNECKVAMDYGQTNPTVFLLIHKTEDGDFVVFDEFYQKECHPKDAAAWLKARGITRVDFADPSVHNKTQIKTMLRQGQQDDYRFSIADEFRNHGITIIRGAQNDIPSGIVRVKEYLKWDPEKKHPFKRDEFDKPLMGSPRLFVTDNCTQTKWEFGQYRWPRDPQGALNQASYEVPLKKDDHAMDALRYALLTWGKPLSQEENRPDPRSARGMFERWKQSRKQHDSFAY